MVKNVVFLKLFDLFKRDLQSFFLGVEIVASGIIKCKTVSFLSSKLRIFHRIKHNYLQRKKSTFENHSYYYPSFDTIFY